ncbi:27386_t:CDS:2, partial [Gigaspora margarita]
DVINNPDLCYENVVRFKRLLDTLHYKSPVVAMTDCTKIKAGLQYSSSLGCIVGSTLNRNYCKIETYDDIYNKVPLPKFLLIIVALIPTGSDNSEKIFALYQKLIDIAADLELYIISIGSDGAAAEFQYFRSIQTDHLLFRKEKKVCEGYSFNEYEEINLLDDDLERLRYWPSDIKIDNAINVGYERAIHLARHLEMNSISKDAYYFNIHKKFSTSQLEDFWNKDLNLETSNNNEYNTDSGLSVSHCINDMISKMNRNQEVNLDPEPELLLEKLYMSCSRSEFTLDNDSLNIEFLLNLYQSHDAHSEKTFERIKFSSKNNNEKNVLNGLNINKATKFDNTLCIAQIIAMYELVFVLGLGTIWLSADDSDIRVIFTANR